MAVAGVMQVTTVRVVVAQVVMRFVRTHAVHRVIFTPMCYVFYDLQCLTENDGSG